MLNRNDSYKYVVQKLNYEEEILRSGDPHNRQKKNFEIYGKNFGCGDGTFFERLFNLNIFSEHSAQLLNYLFKYKYENSSSNRSGIFMKGGAKITITLNNEVGILFEDFSVISMDAYKKYCYGNWTTDEYVFEQKFITAVKTKIAEELKKMWKELNNHGSINEKDDHIFKYKPIISFSETTLTNILKNMSNKKVNDEIYEEVVTYKEYKTLYETLLGKDKKSIIKKYGKETYEKMIGEKNNDPFLINGINVIKNEIKNEIKSKMENIKQLDEEKMIKIEEINNDYDLRKENLLKEFEQRIQNLEKQIKSMSNVS